MMKMKKTKLLIITLIILLLVIVSIIIFINFKNINKNFPDYEKFDVEKLEEIYNTSNISNDFVTSNLINYQGLHSPVYSCNNAKEAIKYMKENYKLGDNTKLLKCDLKEETPYYFAIDHSYIDYRGTGDVTFNSTYIFMKNSVFDIKNSSINTNVIDTKDKIREILNDYIYISECQNASMKIVNSNIFEENNNYTYVLYYFVTTYGDYGLHDEISFNKMEISIDKKSGKINNNSNSKKIKSFQGKYNSYK